MRAVSEMADAVAGVRVYSERGRLVGSDIRRRDAALGKKCGAPRRQARNSLLKLCNYHCDMLLLMCGGNGFV